MSNDEQSEQDERWYDEHIAPKLAEIAKIDGAAERNPLIVALIMRLAHELDSGETESVSASANAMKRMLDDLRKQVESKRLAVSTLGAQIQTAQMELGKKIESGKASLAQAQREIADLKSAFNIL